MSFTHAAFAIAGLIAAAGPVIIHLLNRRRFRTVDWGAMAFLRQAMQRSRRALRLRDVLLLVLRTAAVLLFGFALARPILGSTAGSAAFAVTVVAVLLSFAGAIGLSLARSKSWKAAWTAIAALGVFGLVGSFFGADRIWSSNGSDAASSREPVHAIFVIDNSRSMATAELGKTLLDDAKARAAAALGGLPRGSRISILPLCGPERSTSLDAYLHAEDAQAALDRIEITDRSGSVLRMLSLAAEAAAHVPELPAKQIVFLGDQQANGWPRSGLPEAARTAGGPVQIVQVGTANEGHQSAEPAANVWIESFSLQDGLAEANQPATFLVTLRMTGPASIDDVEVVLTHDGRDAASQTVDLQPGQSREVVLTTNLDAAAAPGAATFVSTTMSLRVPQPAANRLERDDVRHLVVPVVTALPVVFVDQYGEDENLDAGRIGETYRLRRLLAPRPAEGVYDPLVAVRRATIEMVSQSMLEDARLVVLAGIEQPTVESVRLLRAYVEQGGPLLIAAGANFDPAAWTATAWLDGHGILPAPLAATPVGVRPSQATGNVSIEPFRLDGASLGNSLFTIPGESTATQSDLWGLPFFFQAVEADVEPATIEATVATETERIAAERAALADGSGNPAELAPSWLSWRSPRRAAGGDNPDVVATATPDVLAARTAPRVLARFDRPGTTGAGLPYLVERNLGYGRVLMMTSGLSSDWDTLTQTNAIVLLDKITRSMLQETLPRRDFSTGDTITLPIERRADVTYTVSTARERSRPVAVEANDRGYALRLDEVVRAGAVTIEARHTGDDSDDIPPVAEIDLAVNGPPGESDLTRIDPARLARLADGANLHWVGASDELVLTGGPARHRTTWKWLIGAMLLCLLAEMFAAARWRPSAPEAAR